MSGLTVRDNDYFDRCSLCLEKVGKVNLKLCSHCRMVRYCSKDCQKAAWPTHKLRCKTGNAYLEALAQDKKTKALNASFTKWLNCWRATIQNVSLSALDLANHPHDRLATHCVYIEVERRVNPPSVAQSWRMLEGRVLSRDEVITKLYEFDCTEEQIEDWKMDNRGDHTVHIIIRFYGLMRFLWFSLRDLSRYRTDPEGSADLAKGWDQMLMTVIEAGLEVE